MSAHAGLKSGTKPQHYAPAWLAVRAARSRRSLFERLIIRSENLTAAIRYAFARARRLVAGRGLGSSSS